MLVGHPSTQFEKNVTITVRGKPLQMLDGQPAHFSADGIMLSADDRTVFWQATTGQTMYKVPLAALFDRTLTPEALGAKVQVANCGRFEQERSMWSARAPVALMLMVVGA